MIRKKKNGTRYKKKKLNKTNIENSEISNNSENILYEEDIKNFFQDLHIVKSYKEINTLIENKNNLDIKKYIFTPISNYIYPNDSKYINKFMYYEYLKHENYLFNYKDKLPEEYLYHIYICESKDNKYYILYSFKENLDIICKNNNFKILLILKGKKELDKYLQNICFLSNIYNYLIEKKINFFLSNKYNNNTNSKIEIKKKQLLKKIKTYEIINNEIILNSISIENFLDCLYIFFNNFSK